jgi:transcriptional regulator with XRE-family HTH domain
VSEDFRGGASRDGGASSRAEPPSRTLEPQAEIGTTLTILRCARGWSQDDLARASGIRNTSLSDYERSRKLPELGTLDRLVAAMGYSLAAIDYTRRYLAALRADSFLLAGAPRELPAPARPQLGAAARLWEIEQAAAELARAIGRITRLALVILLDRDASSEPAVPSHSEPPSREANAG